jgi:hypothetical protein
VSVPLWSPRQPDVRALIAQQTAILVQIQGQIATQSRKITAMSDSFAAEQAAFTAAFADLKAAITAKMDGLAAQLAAAQSNPGGPTADQLAQMAADVQAIKDETAALTPPAPAAPAA